MAGSWNVKTDPDRHIKTFVQLVTLSIVKIPEITSVETTAIEIVQFASYSWRAEVKFLI